MTADKPDHRRQLSYPFMLLASLAVGVIGGLAAWLFRLLIGLIHNAFFLGEFSTEYLTRFHTAPSPWGIGVIFVPVLGGLVVVWLVKNFAPEAKGHGVPEVMHAIRYGEGRIRPRVAIVKSLASAMSIGTGASVGREGPIIQIGSAFGSMLGQWLPFSAAQRNLLIAAGSGAGIAATFNAPLGGVVFAMELLMLEINARNLLVVATATTVATHLGRLLMGDVLSFEQPLVQSFTEPLHPVLSLTVFIGLGVFLGLACALYIRGLYRAEDLFESLPGGPYLQHAAGMLCVGIIIYLLMDYRSHYFIQGVSYASIDDILGNVLQSPGFLLLLFALKMLSTWLSLGSGASGGIFSPALLLGATGGAAFGHLADALLPGANVSAVACAIVGMAAVVAGSTGALLTGIIMVLEMTADYSLVIPLLAACSVASVVRQRFSPESIYTLKLARRGEWHPQSLMSTPAPSQRRSE
ncbi:MAG: chloride channel protein [Pseudomonadota bacterium]